MVVLIVLPFFLSACISHQQYRNSYAFCSSATPEVDCKESTIQEYNNPSNSDGGYLLGFVEFDDLGQLWDRNQMHSVIDKISNDSINQDVLMVVFVHGWKHSAKANDGNIVTFRKTLKRLSAMESQIAKKLNIKPRKIAGVYLGWRGGSISAPVVKELTFWDRKNTAHKVGFGGATEVLTRLEVIKKTKHEITRKDRQESKTRLVVVGHSFGGAAVYSAVSKILENGFLQTRGPDAVASDAIGFADLVVLINPAFEAMRYSTISDMANERTTYFQSQLPALAVLTSEADNATKLAFPGGRWLSTVFEKTRDVTRYNPITKKDQVVSQGKSNVTALGHFDAYKTHYLKADEVISGDETQDFNLKQEIDTFRSVSHAWEQDKPGSEIQFSGSLLNRTENTAGRNPYLNIRVDKELIKDHNDIDDPRVESFIRQLILISSQSKALDTRKKTRFQTR
jgi:hypothetical protein